MTKSTSSRPFIPYSRQFIDEDDIQAVVDVLKSPFLTTGPKINEFETDFAKTVHSRYAVAFSSGTAALHGAMFAAGIKSGDEILVPTLSFLASANAAAFLGAQPIFVDTKEGELNLDVADAAKKITSKTKAIVPVHFAGEPVDLKEVQELAQKHGLTVIEDAAHALGAAYNGQPIGALSNMTVFSFHPVKHITTGEGGMVTTNNKDLYSQLRRFRHHGIDVDSAAREKQKIWSYDMSLLGFNYRLTDIQAALGISQLKKLEMFLKRRQEIAALYDTLLSHETSIALPKLTPQEKKPSWHLYVVQLGAGYPDGARDKIFSALRDEGVGVQVHYRPIHLHSYYQNQGRKFILPRIEKMWTRFLSLPIFPGMSNGDVEFVADTLLRQLKILRRKQSEIVWVLRIKLFSSLAGRDRLAESLRKWFLTGARLKS